MSRGELSEKLGPIFGDWMTLPGFKELVEEEMIKLGGSRGQVEDLLKDLQTGSGIYRPAQFANEAVRQLDRQVVSDWIIQRKERYADEVHRAVSQNPPILAAQPSESQPIETNKVRYTVNGQQVTEDRFKKEIDNRTLSPQLNQAYALAGSTEDETIKQRLSQEFESRGFKLLWGKPSISMSLDDKGIVTMVSYRPQVMDKNHLGNRVVGNAGVYSGFTRTERLDLTSGTLERSIRWGGREVL